MMARPLPALPPDWSHGCALPNSTPNREQAIAQQYGIVSIPTLAIFRGGREIARQSGALDINRLIIMVKAYI
jgi:thioredoxin 2